MHYPKLKFKIDYKKDVKTFFAFNNETGFDDGRNLKWAILRKYPQFNKYKKGNKLNISEKIVFDFVRSVYLKNRKVIRENISLYQKNWLKIEKDYFLLVDDIFDGCPWPKGKYIVYPTIWGMHPRFLEDKTFQVPYKYKNERYVSVIIAHEMLHFMFYDHIYKKFPKFKNNRYNFDIWHLSEIFNDIIQNSPSWLKIFKKKTMAYPEHKKYLPKMRKLWREIQNVDKWLIEAYEYLQKKRNKI